MCTAGTVGTCDTADTAGTAGTAGSTLHSICGEDKSAHTSLGIKSWFQI